MGDRTPDALPFASIFPVDRPRRFVCSDSRIDEEREDSGVQNRSAFRMVKPDWTIRRIYPITYKVEINSKPPGPDRINTGDEDPFGLSWPTHLSTFLLLYYVKNGEELELEEVLSAQRISHPKMFGYHMYFKASNRKIVGEESQDLVQHKIFAEVNIARDDLKEFIPDVLYCESMSETSEYQNGCHYCPWGVRHPIGMRKIVLRSFPDYVHKIMQCPGVLTPLTFYTTKNISELDDSPDLPPEMYAPDVPSEKDIKGCREGPCCYH